MKIPGPDHPITITHNPKRLRALYQGHVIADSVGALNLKEAGYKAVAYFPREDVAMDFLSRTERRTYCPYKGEASYYSVVRDGHLAENAVWTYEDPYPAVETIRNLVAFYPDQVEIEELDADDARADIADVIRHTDSGAGVSQLEHWPSNVEAPPP
ncbi:MAG: DUF427 domain-containing protein [Caulobacteraceae bacterium]|nr:DUF427 domain-containing protein [Caulobacteraceae bacterium]